VRRPYSDWATGLLTDESWFDCRQGQGVVSAPQNVHTNGGAHSTSLQRVPVICTDGATPYHSPPSTVDPYLHSTLPHHVSKWHAEEKLCILGASAPHAHKVAIRPVIQVPDVAHTDERLTVMLRRWAVAKWQTGDGTGLA
jgi:hypothetical protein